MRQDGAERLYVTHVSQPAANVGVSVILRDAGASIDPWLLGSKDENDVQGAAGTPVNVNPLTFDFRVDIGTAGASMPRPKTYYVAVDSGRDIFTGQLNAGRYLLRSWINDVVPPLILPVTTRVGAGRPTLVMRAVDGAFGEPASGVDPLSLVISVGNMLVGAAAYDAASGLAVFPLPEGVPALRAGRRQTIAVASDFQEAKNINVQGPDIMPNTGFRQIPLTVVARPSLTWLAPETNACATGPQPLLVVASSNVAIRSVQFFDGARRVATDRSGPAGLYDTTLRIARLAKGRHARRAVVTDARGRTAVATRTMRVC
jgi:hypothetical protein